MITSGLYKISFSNTDGSGDGVLVILPDGRFYGGDSCLAYTGTMGVTEGHIMVTFQTTRHSEGNESVFGSDSVNLMLEAIESGTGFSIAQGGLRLVGTLLSAI